MKLLYAEDEPALSEAVVDYLTYQKYIVDAVYDGADAYDYAMFGEYDGIILDIMMPKCDGLEVLSALRRNGKYQRCCKRAASGLRRGSTDTKSPVLCADRAGYYHSNQ